MENIKIDFRILKIEQAAFLLVCLGAGASWCWGRLGPWCVLVLGVSWCLACLGAWCVLVLGASWCWGRPGA